LTLAPSSSAAVVVVMLTISVDSGLGAVSDMVLFPSLTLFFFLFCLPISPVLSSLQIIIFLSNYVR
jgi:hypothetical protein